jgi:hypothetical protein
MVGGIAAFAVVGGAVPLGMVAAALTGAPGLVALRWLEQSLTKRAIDRALIEAVRQALQSASGHPALRRVKQPRPSRRRRKRNPPSACLRERIWLLFDQAAPSTLKPTSLLRTSVARLAPASVGQ